MDPRPQPPAGREPEAGCEEALLPPPVLQLPVRACRSPLPRACRPLTRVSATPPLTDGDGGHDEGIAEEERGGLGGEVTAEVLQEQVLLGLLPSAGATLGSHGGELDRDSQRSATASGSGRQRGGGGSLPEHFRGWEDSASLGRLLRPL